MKYLNKKTIMLSMFGVILLGLNGCDKEGIVSGDTLIGTETVTVTAVTTVTPTTRSDTPKSCLDLAGYGTITLSNGQVWLDRNLGASVVAADINDSEAFGDYYQWGRGIDGHEKIGSSTTATMATTYLPNVGSSWDGSFILTSMPESELKDWTSDDEEGEERSLAWKTPQDDNFDNTLNQVCPCGYIVPTLEDFKKFVPEDGNGTQVISDLKFVVSGYRDGIDGSWRNIEDIEDNMEFGLYFTRDHEQNHSTYVILQHDEDYDEFRDVTTLHNFGFSVRCILATTSVESSEETPSEDDYPI
jgi:uncharacterized protein (TIGR02145 family)